MLLMQINSDLYNGTCEQHTRQSIWGECSDACNGRQGQKTVFSLNATIRPKRNLLAMLASNQKYQAKILIYNYIAEQKLY